MAKLNLAFLFCFILSFNIYGQKEKSTQILILGTFHFSFPNLDVVKTTELKQIDVFEPVYQKEIKLIIKRLKKYKPDAIVIEAPFNKQTLVDSIYTEYIKGNYNLKRNESQQIGFRLANKLGHSKIFCVDEWGDFSPKLGAIVFGKDSVESKKLDDYYNATVDQYEIENSVFKKEGILAEIIRLNDPKRVKESLGYYLTHIFKYESKERDFIGVHYETARWFNRNLKIFRNIQRLQKEGYDKILVIYGAGHLNLLNFFFESSPEYELLNLYDYIKE